MLLLFLLLDWNLLAKQRMNYILLLLVILLLLITIKPKQLVRGFASLNEANVKLLGDFFSIFDENSYIYLFCASKIECREG